VPRARLHSLIVAAVVLLSANRAHADERVPRVAVVVTVQVNVTDLEATLLAERLGDALQDKLYVDAIAGRDVTRRLADFQVPEDCVAQPKCIAKLGKRLDADQIIFLVIVRVGKQFQIDPTWAEVASGRTVAREAISLDESEALPERVFRPRAQKLLPDAKPRQEATTTVIIRPPEEPRGRHFTTATWITGGVGAAALVGGTIFGLQALSTHSSLKDEGCDVSPCPDGPSRADQLETQMTFADVLFGTALVCGAAATYLYYTSAEPRPQAKPRDEVVGVSASAHGVYFNVSGTF
jgi:hypothetical protein